MYKIVYKKSSFSEKYYLLTDARFLQGITHDYWKKCKKTGGSLSFVPPVI